MLIGGDGKAAQNVIAYDSAGVVLSADDGSPSTGVSILGNSFFRNHGPAIDLVQGSNPGAARVPRLTKVWNQGGQTRVQGEVRGQPNSTYVVRFFRDTYNEREGTRYLKKYTVSTDGTGKATFKTTVPKQAAGRWITATATNTSLAPAETSEFAAQRKVQP